MQNSVYHDTASHFLFNDISNPSGREDKNWLKCEGDFFFHIELQQHQKPFLALQIA